MTVVGPFNTSTRFLAALLLCSTLCLLDNVSAADSPTKTGNLRTLAMSKDADAEPMLQDEIEKTLRDRPPLKELPDAKIELARFFDPNIQVRYDEKTKALILESMLTLDPLNGPPPIPAEMLNSSIFANASFVEQFMKREFEGSLPDHLTFRSKPTFEQDEASVVIAEGNDIASSVFGADDRKIFHDHHYPLSTVGRATKKVGWVKFTPSYYNGQAPFGSAWGEKIFYWERFDSFDGLTDHETAFDYVIVVLDRDMGDVTGYTGYKTYSWQWNNLNVWQNIGYPGKLTSGKRPTISTGGAITSVQSQFSQKTGQTGYVLGNFIDLEGGHSGGPVWGWWAGETFPRVVGDISSESAKPGPSTKGDNEAAGGPALSALIGWARSQYPS